MVRLGTFLTGFLGVGVVIALSACVQGEYLTLHDAETEITPCPEPSQIAVESLDTVKRPACNSLGSTLIFPDGTELETSFDMNGQMTAGHRSYAYIGVGIYGVVASSYRGNCEDLQTWGRAEAIEKVQAAFGKNLGNC